MSEEPKRQIRRETTDRTSIDTNQTVPRIFKRGSFTITTSSSVGDYVNGNNATDIPILDEINAPSVDVFLFLNSKLYKIPLVTLIEDSGVEEVDIFSSYEVSSFLSDLTNKIRLNTAIRKQNGSTSDTYTFYYVVYTTKLFEI